MNKKYLSRAILFLSTLVFLFLTLNYSSVIGQTNQASCKNDSDCPLGVCPNGATYTSFSCLDGQCHQLLFFADPCQFLSSSGGSIQKKLNKGFTGVWKARLPKCNLETNQRTAELKNKNCITCEPVQILCIRGTVRMPQTCHQCIHCEKCSDSGLLILKLCVSNGMLEGSASSFGAVKEATVTSQTIISENEVQVNFEDESGNFETATLKLKNPRKLLIEFNADDSVKAIRTGFRGCENNSSSSSSSGSVDDCSSKGSCRGENGEELSCPPGTECSGLPAYGCFPPGCPVPICLSPDTRIRTNTVQKRIADIKKGDIVLSDNEEPVKVKKARAVEVKQHKILSVKFNDATVLEISPNHPTADGRLFKELKMGDVVDGRLVVESKLIPYNYKYTYDILPDSKTGNYYANGILIGSTLK